MKSLALASTELFLALLLALASALAGLEFYAVLSWRTLYFQKFNFATFVFPKTQAANLKQSGS